MNQLSCFDCSYDVCMQFAMGDSIFLKHKNHIAGSAIVSGITCTHLFHGLGIEDGVYKWRCEYVKS